MEAVIPCNTRKRMRETFDHEIAHRNVKSVKPAVPRRKIFFLPTISAILPMGSRNTADARIYPVTIQLRARALAANSFPINGSARFVELPINVVKKDVIITEIRMLFSGNISLLFTSLAGIFIR